MKKYSLTLAVRGKEFEFKSADVIESDSLLEILAQLPLVVRKISELELDKAVLDEHFKRVEVDDDIPF